MSSANKDDHEDLKRLQLEVGGSFFELIEFSLTRRIRGKVVKGIYGVNVAKVREVIRLPKINPLASRIKGVAGIFELRGVPIPAVSLSLALGDDDAETTSTQQIIVSEFSQKRAGFVVDQTHRIRRVGWDRVLPPSADSGSFISGMTLMEDNEFLFILDLERILMHLEFGTQGGAAQLHQPTSATPGMMTGAMMPGGMMMVPMMMMPNGMAMTPAMMNQMTNQMQAGASPQPQASVASGGGNPRAPGILLVEDSAFIRSGVRAALERVGYRVMEAADGVDGLALLERSLQSSSPLDKIDLVVSDIEMPRMDGLSMTKRIRAHPKLSQMPVVMHSSLSGKSNMQAGEMVGANGYVIKNDFRTLFELIREIIGSDRVDALAG